MTRTAEEGSGITDPVKKMLSSCSAPEPLAFQPWMERVAEVKPVSPREEFEMVVMVELFE